MKSGQARVLTKQEWDDVYRIVGEQRHAIRNKAILKILQCLGLRPQEVALIRICEVANLSMKTNVIDEGFTLHEIMPLPAMFTKGAGAMKKKSEPKTTNRTRISYSITEFDRVVKQIERLALAGGKVEPADFYPDLKTRSGVSRDLPMIDEELRKALTDHLTERVRQTPNLKLQDPLFISQKGGAYSPDTLQKLAGKMLKRWGGLQKATSYSGRRGLATNIIHKQKKSIRVAQKILGHKSPSTTYLYDEPPPEEIANAMRNISKP